MINKRLTYNDGGSKPRPKPQYINGNVIDLHPYLDDAWWDIETDKPDEISEKKKEGIMKVASAKDDRDYLKMLLSRYYTPNELFGKTIRELNKLLELHINIQGGLIR